MPFSGAMRRGSSCTTAHSAVARVRAIADHLFLRPAATDYWITRKSHTVSISPVISNIGTWPQDIGNSWLMTTPSPVARVMNVGNVFIARSRVQRMLREQVTRAYRV